MAKFGYNVNRIRIRIRIQREIHVGKYAKKIQQKKFLD